MMVPEGRSLDGLPLTANDACWAQHLHFEVLCWRPFAVGSASERLMDAHVSTGCIIPSRLAATFCKPSRRSSDHYPAIRWRRPVATATDRRHLENSAR